MMNKPLCVILGVGPGNGLAFCNKFVKEGHRVAILARDLGRMQEYAKGNDEVFPFCCDLSDSNSIKNVFAVLMDDLGVPNVVIYNAGSGLFGAPLETTIDDFESAWRVNALGLLCVAQCVTPKMIANGGGNLLVTGATASIRGGAKFAAFSSAKAAQRNLVQSLARSLGPEGIHVALVIIDGIIDTPRARGLFPDQPEDLYMKADEIAETYYHLTQQKSSAWTFEIDLRSSGEVW